MKVRAGKLASGHRYDIVKNGSKTTSQVKKGNRTISREKRGPTKMSLSVTKKGTTPGGREYETKKIHSLLKPSSVFSNKPSKYTDVRKGNTEYSKSSHGPGRSSKVKRSTGNDAWPLDKPIDKGPVKKASKK